MAAEEWYTINDIHKLDTPVLVVYPDRVKHNIRAAIEMAGGAGMLRPHVKTHKSPDATRLMLEAGITKFKCATIAEAEMLGMCQAPDVLLAYQPIGPKLDRFIRLGLAYPGTRFSCLVDNLEAASRISVAASENNVIIPVFIDLNVGQNRTGIAPGDVAFQLYTACRSLAGLQVIGLHAYDGHVHEADLAVRTAESDRCFRMVKQLRARIMGQGHEAPVIIAGGSPTFPVHARRSDVECSPGTFVYWDKGYLDGFPEQPFLPAALVITRVISLPGENEVCLDLGHKSIAAERELKTRVYLLNAPELVPVGQSEEHLVVKAPAGHAYRPGDVIYGMPYHVCPTVALYERAITIEEKQVSGEWRNAARDRKLTI